MSLCVCLHGCFDTQLWALSCAFKDLELVGLLVCCYYFGFRYTSGCTCVDYTCKQAQILKGSLEEKQRIRKQMGHIYDHFKYLQSVDAPSCLCGSTVLCGLYLTLSVRPASNVKQMWSLFGLQTRKQRQESGGIPLPRQEISVFSAVIFSFPQQVSGSKPNYLEIKWNKLY